MAHDTVFGICENKCLVEVDTKANTDAVAARVTAIEGEVNGALKCKSVTTSGTITSTGKITANGGIGTKALTATSISNSGNMTNTGTLTSTGKITANGGIGTTSLTTSSTITSTGKITANGGLTTKVLSATSISNSGNMTNTGTLTSTGKITANGGIGTKALTATTGTFSGAVTADTITANNLSLSGDLNCTINRDSTVISGVYLNTNPQLLYATSNTTRTFTYKSNPFCNTVKFSIKRTYDSARGYVNVNGTTLINSSTNSDVTSDNVTLKDGDTITVGASGAQSNSPVTITLLISGYLISS